MRITRRWIEAIDTQVDVIIREIEAFRQRNGRLPEGAAELLDVPYERDGESGWRLYLHNDPKTVPVWCTDHTPLHPELYYCAWGSAYQLHLRFHWRPIQKACALVFRSDGEYPDEWTPTTVETFSRWVVLWDDDFLWRGYPYHGR